jgi:hypothetical protein
LKVTTLNLHSIVVRQLGDLVRVFINHLQEALDSTRGMFRTLSIVAMRKQHYEATLLYSK